jgi:uncharacterized membrane protein
MDYLTLKWLHILSSVLLVGTGFGSAFYLFFANRVDNVAVRAEVARLVVRADWWFTTPAIIFQPLSGLWLMHLAGWSWSTPWIAGSIALFLFAGACWLPVVWLQIRMEKLARQSASGGTALPSGYERRARLWEWLGYPAFTAMLAVFYLMVTKPGL